MPSSRSKPAGPSKVDVVIYATSEHWHYLPCIHPCQAGKHRYGEQPLGHTMLEGRRMIQAVRKYQRVFQTGDRVRELLNEQLSPSVRPTITFVLTPLPLRGAIVAVDADAAAIGALIPPAPPAYRSSRSPDQFSPILSRHFRDCVGCVLRIIRL